MDRPPPTPVDVAIFDGHYPATCEPTAISRPLDRRSELAPEAVCVHTTFRRAVGCYHQSCAHFADQRGRQCPARSIVTSTLSCTASPKPPTRVPLPFFHRRRTCSRRVVVDAEARPHVPHANVVSVRAFRAHSSRDEQPSRPAPPFLAVCTWPPTLTMQRHCSCDL